MPPLHDESVDAPLRAATTLIARASQSSMGTRGLGELLTRALEQAGIASVVVLRTAEGAAAVSGRGAGTPLELQPDAWAATLGVPNAAALTVGDDDLSVTLIASTSAPLDAALSALLCVDRAARLERAAEQQLELHELRRRADRLNESSLLIRGFAHEFRNILNVLLSALEMPAEHNSRGELVPADLRLEELIGSLAEARSSTARSQFLVDRVSYIIKAEHTDLFTLDVGEALYDAEYSLQRAAGNDRQLELTIGEDLPQVLAEPNYLGHMIAELVENAQSASASGDPIGVKVSRLDVGAGGSALHPRLKPGAWVHIEVSDVGEGMAPSIADRAFQGFYGNSRSRARLGLGLTEAGLVTSRFQGQIRVDTRAYVGTTVHIFLPDAALAAAGALSSVHIDVHAEAMPSVAIAINNSGDLVLVEALLRSAGFGLLNHPAEAANVGEPFETVARARPALLIIDDPTSLQPGGFAHALRARVPELGVVFLGWALPGADGHLTSKLSQFTLTRELRRVLELRNKPPE